MAAMKEVAGPVMATALVLAAVFFPCMLLPGITGRLFAQFSVTIGVSIIISAFTALSLSPALAVLLLRPRGVPQGVFAKAGGVFNRCLETARRFFVSTAGAMIRRGAITGLVLLGAAVCIYPLAKQVPGGFLPTEDEGYFYGSLQMPHGTSLGVTQQSTEKIIRMLKQEQAIDGVVMVNGFDLLTGVQSPNNAFFFIALKPWEERDPNTQNATALSAKLRQKLNALQTGGVAFTMTPPPIPGVGASSDVTLMLEDRAGKGDEYLAAQTADFVAAVSQLPEVAAVQNMMAADTPQYLLTLNVEKALSQGVDPDAAFDTLQTFLGSSFINYFNIYGYQYRVYMQADAAARMQVEELSRFYLPGAGGAQVPLDAWWM